MRFKKKIAGSKPTMPSEYVCPQAIQGRRET